MEFRSGEPEGAYKVDADGARKLCKVVVVKALRDMGSGPDIEREKVWSWVNSHGFEEMCSWAGWGEDWIADLFSSVYHLSPSVRRPITRDCVVMLKRLGRIE